MIVAPPDPCAAAVTSSAPAQMSLPGGRPSLPGASIGASARAYQHASWVAAGLAGVGAVASGYLWRRALRAPATVDVAPTAGGVALSVATTF